jgi:hypothetical protein
MEIAKWNESKWLVLSSLLFTIPSAFAYYHHLYSYSGLLLLTTIVSVNYWRDAAFSWRRNLDIFVARTGFIVFLITGILYVTWTPYLLVGYTGLGCLALSYIVSGKLWNENNPNWYKYHMLFHLLLMSEQLIILDSIR